MASIQRRSGPNITGFWGFLQPFADGLKLIVKEIVFPNQSNKFLFFLASSITLFLSLISWVVIPFNIFNILVVLDSSLLYILVISALSVYGILLAGWSSSSKYALLGSLRSVSQIISYEVFISLIILQIILFSGSLNLQMIVLMQIKTIWFLFPLFPLVFFFFLSMLAETNRVPFDLPEAEAELVAGYNVEYSGFLFASFFLGEYSNILLMSTFFVLLFLAGGDFFGFLYLTLHIPTLFSKLSVFYDIFLAFKIIVLVFLFVFIRANLPRFRFDQLMFIGWKVCLPFTLCALFFFPSVLYVMNAYEIKQLPRLSLSFNYIETFAISY